MREGNKPGSSSAKGVAWQLNRSAMIAIIPKPSDSIIDLYTMDRNRYTIRFSGNANEIMMDLFLSYVDNGNENLIHLANEHIGLDRARHYWNSFVEKGVPYPDVLKVPAVPHDRRFGGGAFLASVLLALGIGFSLGWLAVDRVWLQGQIGMGAVTTAQQALEGAAAGGAISSAPLPEIQGSAATPTPSSADPVLMVPSSASPGLRDIASGGQAAPDAQSAPPPPMPEPNADALIALRELREVIQRGGRVDENLFRRLPQDIQDILRAEGFAPQSSASQTSDESARSSEARLPTGAVLRGGTDAQGVPVLPRRLPPGESSSLPVPLPGGGDLREAEDFRAFGLQAPR